MRQQNQDLQMDYDEKKSTYDSTALQLQTNMAKVEIEVKKMREEIQTAETRLADTFTYFLVLNSSTSILGSTSLLLS